MNLSQLKQIQNSAGYTLCCAFPPSSHVHLYLSHAHGIAPILSALRKHPTYFQDGIVVDAVIGKAAAMLFIRSQVQYVHARVMSEAAKQILEAYQIPYSYDLLTPLIRNRQNSGQCPMEETVKDLVDLEEAYEALQLKVKQLRATS